MRFQQYIIENTDFLGVIKNLSSMPYKRVEQFLRDQFDKFVTYIPSLEIEHTIINIINKNFDTHYRSLKDIADERVPQLRESYITEDIEHWWKSVKTEAFPTLAFYPALNAWLEIDKLLRGQDINIRVLVIYTVFWLLLISGKYIKGWMEWKKQNPEEYESSKK